ncbi:hypothetical protein N7520_004283 [Penicillium odoratum]|uniref:uncharacterized protein n=1 Tax=Penicillium odoratum TaxID=1167516 RepID=UPI002548D571|nr:uncharacterized protein N7520_004283 [Penicillium odoratum]KAJ5764724.1 hypothetical protein N7520_004283 [Penicillium odoratum]
MARQIPFISTVYLHWNIIGPADCNGVRIQDEVFEIPCRHTRENKIARETETHDSSTQPAPEYLNQQRHLRKDCGDAAAFEIIQYIPEGPPDPEVTDGSKPSRSKKDVQKTLSRFISFMDGLPKSKIWENWVSAIDKTRRGNFLRALVQNCGSSTSSLASLGTTKELADMSSTLTNVFVLSEYASFMGSYGIVNQQLTCFLNMVFVSLCAVALENNEDKDGVWAVMRKVLGSDASSKQLGRLVRGAKWANGLVSLFLKTKWESRSWDILCVAQHPVSFYARLSDCSVDKKEILEKVGTNVHDSSFMSGSTGLPAPFAIPLIVERVFKNNKSLKVICKCLGYEVSSVRSYQTPFNKALGYHSAKKRPASTQLKPSKRRCPDFPPDNDGQRSQISPLRAANTSASGLPPADGGSRMPAQATIDVLELAPAQRIQSDSGDAWPASVAINAGNVSIGCPSTSLSLPMDMQSQASPTNPASNYIPSADLTTPPSSAISHSENAFLNSSSEFNARTMDAALLSCETYSQPEPTATGVLHIIDGGPPIDTNSADWQQSSIDINGAALSESASRSRLTGSSTYDQRVIPTSDGGNLNLHNELYTLFDHDFTSAALPDAMLWRLFPPENDLEQALCLPHYPL